MSSVSQRENPDGSALQKTPALKFYLAIIKTTGQQVEASTGSQLLR